MRDEGDASGGGGSSPALNGGNATSSTPPTEAHSVVPADQLLEVAAALSEGASRVHAQLRDLSPVDRDAVLDIVADQLTEIVTLFTSLVRGVVTADAPQDPRSNGHTHHEDSAVGEEVTTEPKLAVVRHNRAVPERVPVVADTETPDTPDDAHTTHRGDAAPEPAVHINPYRRPVAPGAEVPSVEPLTRDELTGVLTRQAGFAALTKEIDRCRHGGDRFVLGYLNVDGLQAVNETRGPAAGDELLRKVTAALRATLRSYDIIARLGGDEFLFSLPGADMATAELRFKEFAVILAEEAPGGSASVGFAQLRESDTIDDLIARADTALLKSRRGRRRSAR